MSDSKNLCPGCWHTFPAPTVICPQCGGDVPPLSSTANVPDATDNPVRRGYSLTTLTLWGLAYCGIGLALGIWSADRANSRRVASAEERAEQLASALRSEGVPLDAPSTRFDDAQTDRIVAIGGDANENSKPQPIASTSVGTPLGVSRSELIAALDEVYAIKVLKQEPELLTVAVASSVVLQIFGDADRPSAVSVVVPDEDQQLAGRVLGEVARQLYKEHRQFGDFVDWFTVATLRCGPNMTIVGRVEPFLVSIEHLQLDASKGFTVRIFR